MTIALLLSACGVTGAQPAPPDPQPVARIIVKPRSHYATGDALLAAIRDKSEVARQLVYYREMSGDAHVLTINKPATRDEVPKIIDTLIATGLFEYVELDRMMTIHTP